MLQKNFNTDANENKTACPFDFILEKMTETVSDENTGKREREGRHAYYQSRRPYGCLQNSEGDSHCKSIDAGSKRQRQKKMPREEHSASGMASSRIRSPQTRPVYPWKAPPQ